MSCAALRTTAIWKKYGFIVVSLHTEPIWAEFANIEPLFEHVDGHAVVVEISGSGQKIAGATGAVPCHKKLDGSFCKGGFQRLGGNLFAVAQNHAPRR